MHRRREELSFPCLSEARYHPSALPEDRLLAPPAPIKTIRPQSPLAADPLDNSQRHLIRRLLSEQLPSQWPSRRLPCAQRMLMASGPLSPPIRVLVFSSTKWTRGERADLRSPAS